jgi:asparagine synthase (glutamine-hydrolysing)
MCGICGTINFNGKHVQKNVLERMNNSLVHRGPDDSGIHLYKNIGIAHRRLSIIDLSSGHQPLCNEDGSIWITFNGEIYNYKQLRRYLDKKGHIFKTNCDTEVIVHLYEEFGKESVAMLEGMFAYAILDQNINKLLIYRDRFGQKPLCYTFQNNSFVFGSELQTITLNQNVEKNINFQSLHDYLTLQYVPAPNTIYKNIKKLLPANYLEIDINHYEKTDTHTYWKCDFQRKTDISYDDAKVKLRHMLKNAVDKRLMSDVPLGSFLSGGIDSSIVTGLMSEITDTPVKTFTIGFNNSNYDERNFASIAAKRFGTEHNVKIVNPQNFSIIEELVKNYGEPYADASMLPTYLLSKFARQKVTVALSGDGADEFFAGYYRYLLFKHSLATDTIPQSVRNNIYNFSQNFIPSGKDERSFAGKAKRVLKMSASDRNERYLEIISRTPEILKNSIYGKEINYLDLKKTQSYFNSISHRLTAENPVEKLMETDIYSYLPYDILSKIDIASMSNSLELRSPFMDHKLIEFVNSLPLKYKQGFKTRKKILIDTFSDMIPKELQSRNKMGFGVPISSWLRDDWKRISTELILDGNGIKNGFFSKIKLSEILKSHQNNQADYSYLIWSLMIFELWYAQVMK